ncbi:MAG TPA: hypothetical protein ENJ28_06175 [Gammaproteobacteria bacterium]|nr:hypothetical protein [Gammaproteobacteria bacterium]
MSNTSAEAHLSHTIVRFIIIIVLVMCAPYMVGSSELCGVHQKSHIRDVPWFQGAWGVRVALPAGNQGKISKRFFGGSLLDQLLSLKTNHWVMLNLTAPSFGGLFTARVKEVSDVLGDQAQPPVDLLDHYVNRLKKAGYRVILYVAAQGPSLEFLGDRKDSFFLRLPKRKAKILSSVDQQWNSYLTKMGKRANGDKEFAKLISAYSRKFGAKIDGWWFDHGVHARPEILIPAARIGNKNVIVAWNGRKKFVKLDSHWLWPLERTTLLADFTDGHVSPTSKNGKGVEPWWFGNHNLIEQVVYCDRISGALPHVFIPLQSTWRGGKNIFPSDLAVRWTKEVIKASGAITWAAALRSPEFSRAEIAPRVYRVLQRIDSSF